MEGVSAEFLKLIFDLKKEHFGTESNGRKLSTYRQKTRMPQYVDCLSVCL